MNPTELATILAAHEAWLEDSSTGKRADLRRADLRRADLRRADLREANLRRADLREADLSEANLYGANLGGANLEGAELREAELREAELREANLEGADLPSGMGWWQGGAYGPRRRMIRALKLDGVILIMAGCLSGSPEGIKAQLAGNRHPAWVDEIGQEAADRALRQATQLIDLAVDSLTEVPAS